MADRRTDAAIAGAVIGALIAGAAARNRNNGNNGNTHRYNYATDSTFFPNDLPNTICYSRARTCYEGGHYSAWATRRVFG
jgi:hypothetical protein